MDTESIIAELEAEREHLTQAIDALRGSHLGRGRGNRTTTGQRRLSAAARRKISEAMKKRWAARKKAA